MSPAKSSRKPMKKPISLPDKTYFEGHERAVILFLCVLGAFRVFLFTAAFPFYNNVDEPAHYDLVYKYSIGHIPVKIEHVCLGSSAVMIIYNSHEYFRGPEEFGGMFPPPAWELPLELVKPAIEQGIAASMKIVNHESTQPPVYYALAGDWYRLGRILGLGPGNALYWIKFLNVIVFGLLIWVSYMFARRFYPSRPFLRFGVPLLLAFFPQDVFYGINSDIPSALLFGASLYCLLDLYVSDSKSHLFYTLTGLLVAAAFLTKYSNVAVLGIFTMVAVLRIAKLHRSGKLGRELPGLVLMFVTLVLPISLWLARSYYVVGDITGSAEKIKDLHWKLKPLGQVWFHPIFTPKGLAFFWHGLMKTFWRGEFIWYGRAMNHPFCDNIYSLSSLVFLLASGIALIRRRGKDVGSERFADLTGFLALGISILFIAAVSIAYDFHNCWYPSRQLPFLTSGRLITGALIPFVALYLKGLEIILEKLRLTHLKLAIVLIIIAVISVSETVLSVSVFESMYNWFHMI